ncbi:type I-C CRISPR-associated protein Cas7/Csd2, partial [Alkalihalophilus lindianensis]|nr:type I-C CRISPR-associated protein Cas7/Csd2 [Alkalihalophilus lindianensis]
RLLEIHHNVEEPKAFEDYSITLNELEGLKVEIIDGL